MGQFEYLRAVERAFRSTWIDYAMLEKLYGPDPAEEKRYSPSICLGIKSRERAPLGVLAREAQDELAELTADSRAAGPPSRVGPAPRHEPAMPAKERFRRDEERTPALARDEPARSRQECSVGWSKRGASNLAAKDRELVPKHHDLQLFEFLGAEAKRDELEQASQSDVEKRSEQGRPPVFGGETARLYGGVSLPGWFMVGGDFSLGEPDRVCAPHKLLAAKKIKHLRTEPYRPQTNGKVERFHQTMAREWAYGLAYRSHRHRNRALPHWLRHYNERRPHSSLEADHRSAAFTTSVGRTARVAHINLFNRSRIGVELALWPESSAEARKPPTAQSVPRGERRGHLI